ncbi:hypothetical protein SCOR_17140 [Sulfidibacter corallicola]|uniref:Uncharacterized protein n=1 Tax=Sulfidibacter corallicola TaxID=2818388 RepID=A0A8A4TV29_SULCO|nr:hypothetical protein [Sulfidibacter corallicola]QTD53816.1 hypothetical protein J3U87_15305 [Sulfidibacter corallicola]
MLQAIRKFTGSPFVQMTVGLIFLMTGLSETFAMLKQDLADMTPKAHHGVVIFSLFQCLKILPEFVEGVEYMNKDGDEDDHSAKGES